MSLLRSTLFVSRHCGTRAFTTTGARLVASNFGMPAMSPTMTEGGIVDWKFKEGDSFNAGDILLEIETDKAQIDVEAQDDGILAKVYIPSGTTGIPVGKTIAVLAEPGDDLKTLEIPKPEEGSSGPSSVTTPAPAAASSSSEAPEQPKGQTPTPSSGTPESSNEAGTGAITTKANPSQTLSPSVLALALDNNLTKQDVLDKVPASGPKGRVLKGDILAFLGKVPRADVDSIVNSIQRLQHLDLSKINIKKPTASTPAATAAPTAPKVETSEKSEKAPAPKKPEVIQPPAPTVLSAFFTLGSISTLQKSLETGLKIAPPSAKLLVEKASKRAIKDSNALYAARRAKTVLFDPVFEEIIAPNTHGQAPFVVSFKYPTAPLASAVSKSDIYDGFLSKKSLSPKKSAQVAPSELLKVEVTLNSKYPGAPEKAKIYIDQLGFYLSQGTGELIL